VLDWGDREAIRQGYAATLVKRQAQRPTFETLFDLYFPRLVGEGTVAASDDEPFVPGTSRDGTVTGRLAEA